MSKQRELCYYVVLRLGNAGGWYAEMWTRRDVPQITIDDQVTEICDSTAEAHKAAEKWINDRGFEPWLIGKHAH